MRRDRKPHYIFRAARRSHTLGASSRKEHFISNATSAEIAKARRNWKDEHLDMYLGSGGVL